MFSKIPNTQVAPPLNLSLGWSPSMGTLKASRGFSLAIMLENQRVGPHSSLCLWHTHRRLLLGLPTTSKLKICWGDKKILCLIRSSTWIILLWSVVNFTLWLQWSSCVFSRDVQLGDTGMADCSNVSIVPYWLVDSYCLEPRVSSTSSHVPSWVLLCLLVTHTPRVVPLNLSILNFSTVHLTCLPISIF